MSPNLGMWLMIDSATALNRGEKIYFHFFQNYILTYSSPFGHVIDCVVLLSHVQVIYHCTLEYPYHCLYIILALSNASKDDQFPKSRYVTGKSSTASKLHQISDSADEVVCS